MPITLLCPSCETELKAGDQMRGRTVACPQCGASLVVEPISAQRLAEVLREREKRDALYQRIAPNPPPESSASPESPSTTDQEELLEAGEEEAAIAYRELPGEPPVPIQKKAARTTPPTKKAPILSIGGTAISSGQLMAFALAAILLLLGGLQFFHYIRNNTDGTRILSVEEVTIFKALTGVKHDNLVEGEASYTLGGDDEIVLTTPESTGDYVLLTVELSQDMFFTFAKVTPAGLVLDTSLFQLRGGTLDSVAMHFAEQLPNATTIDLQAARGTSGWAALPPTVDPASELDSDDHRATLVYDDQLAKGKVNFRPDGAGITATGDIVIQTPLGGLIDYHYADNTMRLFCDQSHTAWRQSRYYSESPKAGITGPRTFKLLFHRTTRQGSKRLALYLGDIKLTDLSNDQQNAVFP